MVYPLALAPPKAEEEPYRSPNLEPLNTREIDMPDGRVVRYAPIQIYPPYIQSLRDAAGVYRLWADDPDEAIARLDSIRDDGQVYSAIQYLALEAVGTEQWDVQPTYDEFTGVAQIVETAFRRIPEFTSRRMALVENALLTGMGLLWVTWQPVQCRLRPDTEIRTWMMPVALTEVDKRQLRLVRQPRRKDVGYWTVYDVGIDAYVVVEDRDKNPRAAIAMQDFVWHKHRDKPRNAGFGEGLYECLYELVSIKERVLQYRATLAERWAEPTFIHTFSPERGGLGATLNDNFVDPYTRADKLQESIRKWRARHTLSIPDHDKLDIHEHGGTASAQLEAFLEYLDAQIRTVILANPLALGERTTGGLGSGQEADVGRDATQAVIDYHRSGGEAALDTYLVHEFVKRNTGNLLGMNLPIPDAGEIGIKFGQKPKVRQDELKTKLEIAQQWGLPVSEPWMRDALDMPSPGPNEQVLQPQAPMGGLGGPSSLGFRSHRAFVPPAPRRA